MAEQSIQAVSSVRIIHAGAAHGWPGRAGHVAWLDAWVAPGVVRCTDVQRVDDDVTGFPRGSEMIQQLVGELTKDDFDYLATYDLPQLAAMLPFGEVRAMPWIDLHRVVVTTASLVSDTVGSLLLQARLITADELAAAGPEPDAAWETQGIARMLGHLAGQHSMPHMAMFSRAIVRPCRPAPALCDAAGWALVPEPDLRWLADYRDRCRDAGIPPQATPDAATCTRAAAELTSRRHMPPLQARVMQA